MFLEVITIQRNCTHVFYFTKTRWWYLWRQYWFGFWWSNSVKYKTTRLHYSGMVLEAFKSWSHVYVPFCIFKFINPAFALLSTTTSWAQVKSNWGNINWLTTILISSSSPWFHDDVIKWKHFPRYWPFVPGIHRSPVNSPHKGQWRGALMFSLIYVWINGSVNNGEAGDLRRHRAHYEVTVLLALTC